MDARGGQALFRCGVLMVWGLCPASVLNACSYESPWFLLRKRGVLVQVALCMALLTVFACSDDKEGDEDDLRFEVSASELTFPDEGGTQTLMIYTDLSVLRIQGWRVSDVYSLAVGEQGVFVDDYLGMTVYVLRTNEGYEVEINLLPNDEYKEIDVRCEFFGFIDVASYRPYDSYGGAFAAVEIHQDQKSDIFWDVEGDYTALSEGEEVSFELQGTVEYEVLISSNAQSWIEQVIEGRALITDKLTFKIDPNDTQEDRSGEIVLKAVEAEVSDTLRIYQAPLGVYVGDVEINTAEESKAFADKGYKIIRGNCVINTNPQLLNNQLEEIDGDLFVGPQMTTFDGLYGLKRISGNLTLDNYHGTSFVFSSFEGLNNLISIGENLDMNDNVRSYKGLESLESIGGNFWTEISIPEGELENLRSIGGDFQSLKSSNYEPGWIPVPVSLKSLESVGGDLSDLILESVPNLATIGGNVVNVESRDALDKVTRLDGNVEIFSDIAILNHLESVGGDLELLEGVAGMNSLSEVGGDLVASGDVSGLKSL